MKLSIFLSNVILAVTILAAPCKRELAEQVERGAATLATNSTVLARTSQGIRTIKRDTPTAHSYQWGGAVLTAPPAGAVFKAVSGQFTVPGAYFEDGQPASTAIWIGIDGQTYQSAILQAGIYISVNSDGSQSSYAWYEWYPSASIQFTPDQFSFTSGDVIKILVTSGDSHNGEIVLENGSTGQIVYQSLSQQNPSANLGGQNAEWVVEDVVGSLANFGTVTFSNCVAEDSNGDRLGTDGATIFILEDRKGNVLTDVCLPDSSEVQIVYR